MVSNRNHSSRDELSGKSDSLKTVSGQSLLHDEHPTDTIEKPMGKLAEADSSKGSSNVQRRVADV